MQKNIEIEYVDADIYNDLLVQNYKKGNIDSLSKEFNKRQYENLRIVVDISQRTPLAKTSVDTSKMTIAEYDAKIDSMNSGQKISGAIPLITTYYDAFPVTIYNLEKWERIIGFGNSVALQLEALDKNHKWQRISNFRRYTCGVGIKYFVLKPQEIATVFEPRLNGKFKTKLRYRLGNVLSNEFEGNINDKYLTD